MDLERGHKGFEWVFFIISSERLSSYFSQSSSEEWIGGGIVFALDP
jgi:hypothetical protein